MTVRSAVLAGAIALLTIATPCNALGWTPVRPVVKERGLDPVTLHLAVANDRQAVFGWLRGPFGFPHSPGLVQARTLGKGGKLSPVATLRRMPLGHEGLPQVAMGTDGTAAVVWLENLSRGVFKQGAVYAAVRSDGHWASPVRVGISKVFPEGGTGAGAEGDSPKVAIDKRGKVLVLWEHDRGSLQVARKAPGHRFAKAQTIPVRVGRTAVEPSQISLAFDGAGNAYASWATSSVVVHGKLAHTDGLWVAERPARAGHFGSISHVSALGTLVGETRMAVASNGMVAVIWTQPTEFTDPAGDAWAMIRLKGKRFSRPQLLSGGCAVVSPRIVASPGGMVTAAWVDACGQPQLSGAASANGAPFGPGEPIYDAGPNANEFGFLDLASMGSGTAVAVFSPDAQASVREPGGPFGAPELIANSPAATTPRVAAAGRLAIAGWQGAGGFYYSTLTG